MRLTAFPTVIPSKLAAVFVNWAALESAKAAAARRMLENCILMDLRYSNFATMVSYKEDSN